ncbi:MAG: RNB domain-containing ribonuclease, partial [Sinobacteraceae bacterium]|nr:RNB domain-containing ribonuclease [Nevskiaceae bacterium]
DRGLLPDFDPAAIAQAASLIPAASEPSARDLRELLWVSIDNDDSRDLDQVSVAQSLGEGRTRTLIAIADVDALVAPGSPIDAHALHNTTSVYTAAQIFPMLPERLSTDVTSLRQDQDRLAMIIDLVITSDGRVVEDSIYRGVVRNRAKLAYSSISSWLDGKTAPPPPLSTTALQEQVRLQDSVAQALGRVRHERGALSLETLETSAVFDGDALRDLVPERQDRAQQLIENLMIAANECAARWLRGKGFPSIRRVLQAPQKWDRIAQLAAELGGRLPSAPDARALNEFLMNRRAQDPVHFPDLSLSIIKLLGRGEYALEIPGHEVPGHFGLAASDYLHSTAPNRRFPDLLTQRLIKATLTGSPPPYSIGELQQLAAHCSEQEDNAAKVERRVEKSAAALLLQPRVGQTFDAIVTGAADKGTWARLLAPPVEGRVVRGNQQLQVGQHVRVKLLGTDVARGFIDLAAGEGSS